MNKDRILNRVNNSIGQDKAVMTEIIDRLTGNMDPQFEAILNIVEKERTPMAIVKPPTRSSNPLKYEDIINEGLLSMQNEDGMISEAIIHFVGRPALLIQNDDFEVPISSEWAKRLNQYRDIIRQVVPSVGRLDLENDRRPYAGTGWLINDTTVATNRHVTEVFGEKNNNNYSFRKNPEGRTIKCKIDFKEEYQVDADSEVPVKEILFMTENRSDEPDTSLLKLAYPKSGHASRPIKISQRKFKAGHPVAIIGYPAFDGNNHSHDVFNFIYNVKRLQPGYILQPELNNLTLTHDCSTLGGNSGSVLIDLESGEAVGLHFAGQYLVKNYAVRGDVLSSIVSRI